MKVEEIKEATETEMNKSLQEHLEKLFSGKYDVMVKCPDDETQLNFSELMRLVVHTLRSVSQKIIQLEELEQTKNHKSK